MPARALHLHTYFLFPFAVDKEAVMHDHQSVWLGCEHWIDGLDAWIGDPAAAGVSPIANRLGRWIRDPYTRFDMESAAYQDMVFFHPFVRRVFFDTKDASGLVGENESLVRSYQIPLHGHHESGRKLFFQTGDARGRSAKVEVTDLRLMMFANSIGILSVGVEAFSIPVEHALWINETMRKVYPSSGRQLREGRTANHVSLLLEGPQGSDTLADEKFERCVMKGFLPPLSKAITDLLYFANYDQQEYEPVLDERMIVYTHLAVDPASVDQDFDQTEEYEILMSRLLYVDRWGDSYRYEADFTREAMRQQVYRRWAHQGTLYGFTSYSNVTMSMGSFDCDEHQLREGFLIHRMFTTRYYFTVMVALFYRATLLDFSERTALVSRQLFRFRSIARISQNEILLAVHLLSEFQHFSNYWYFSELANKDEEIEHFQMQCVAYRLDGMKREIEQEIEKLSDTLGRFYQMRSTEAVNRLAMLSMILGGGAMVTGYFGMNFGQQFEHLFFNPAGSSPWAHTAAIIFVSAVTVGSLLFGIFLVVRNWSDYRTILIPPSQLSHERQESLRRTPDWTEPPTP
jgi:hypothetical protein